MPRPYDVGLLSDREQVEQAREILARPEIAREVLADARVRHVVDESRPAEDRAEQARRLVRDPAVARLRRAGIVLRCVRLLSEPQPLADLCDEAAHRASLRRFASRFAKPSLAAYRRELLVDPGVHLRPVETAC